ncbi:hypothetical protein MNBD_BACTEROID02-1018 [hydrothermal vent metagenome]|uniref:Uncharacterized protein n=1 Tax=hydrothermal vent metagenome TaxID=652676 RepID=A0A3B0QWC5_9ZZZZ
MVLNSIEKLLEKYDNGETTLQEEQQLKNYFSQETVPPHLEVYKSMFQYFLQTHEEQFTKDVPLKPRKTNTLYKWISVAAIAVLMFGIYTQVGNQPQTRTLADLSPTEREAYDKTMEVFNLVSSKLNEGSENMNTLSLVSSNFDKGADNIAYISEFSRATNKFLKTN